VAIQARRRSLGLPLLAKELTEQSARLRTYVIRSVYALLLFGFSLLLFWGSTYSRSANPLDVLGQGRELFLQLMVLQMAGILLFAPALTCGSITQEKEKNTFGLLLLTRLGPWTILFEKYLGRVFVMGTFLLISLPLFGFCYSLGGLDQRDVWAGFYSLAVTVLQISALGLFCSSFFRTTVAALIATYLLGIALLFGPLILIQVVGFGTVEFWGGLVWWCVEFGFELAAELGEAALHSLSWLLAWDPPPRAGTDWVIVDYMDREMVGMIFFAPGLIMDAIQSPFMTIPDWQMAARGMPALMSAVVLFLAARLFVVRRAFATSRNYVLRFFRLLDGLFHRLNQNRITRGIVLVDEKNVLPEDEPVAWRETTKTSLGTFRYLVRIFLVLEFPVLFLCIVVMTNPTLSGGRHPAVTFVVTITWLIAVLLTTVKAASLIAGERSRETLDVLLSTPIRSEELIRQKFKGLWRVMTVAAIPLMTAIVTQAWYASLSENRYGEQSAFCYFVIGMSSVLIYLPLAGWFSFLMGLWMKTSTRAIFASLAILLAWIILPFPILATLFDAFGIGRGSPLGLTVLVSPAVLPLLSEANDMDHLFRGQIWLPVVINILVYGTLLFGIRRFALNRASRLLGRAETDSDRASKPSQD
jgi:ABC-type transport system involved in multi-copper enzyme maturation permease subunit